MRTFLHICLGVLLGVVGIYLFQQYFGLRTIAQNIEQYIPNTLRQKLSPTETSKNFLESEIARLKSSGEVFVLANLSLMQLEVYENGVPTLTLPIQAKGREGSWWETPAGVYSIKSKERNHLSSIGNVYMPWSMQFQGNFFIHGLPYYPNGDMVSTSYSGGCIRLNTDDAKKVYDLVKQGVPVVVYENTAPTTEVNSTYVFGPGSISAKRFLAADLTNGFTFASQGAENEINASAALNLLTAIVSAEYMDIERNITADESDQVTTSKPRLQAGKKYAVYDYLYILLQESSQEAAHILARALGLSRTVELITQKAKAIGMEKSVFTSVSVSSPTNTTTLSDTYQLLRYMYFNRKFLLTISANTAETRIYGAPAFSDIKNSNLFEGESQFIGGFVSSTGTTGLFVFEIPFGEVVRPVAIVVDGSQDVRADVESIKTFVQASFKK